MTIVVVRLFFRSEEIESYKGNQGNEDENEDETKVFLVILRLMKVFKTVLYCSKKLDDKCTSIALHTNNRIQPHLKGQLASNFRCPLWTRTV